MSDLLSTVEDALNAADPDDGAKWRVTHATGELPADCLPDAELTRQLEMLVEPLKPMDFSRVRAIQRKVIDTCRKHSKCEDE